MKRPAVVTGHDEVIEHLDLQPVQYFLQFVGEFLVAEAGAGLSIGMVVRENHCGGIVRQRTSCHLSRIHRSACEGPLRQGFAGDQTVPDIQKQHDKALIALPGKLRQKKMF